MGKARNILFIMADQLRWDYLSAAGHPTLETPNIDRLAARGVMFSRAYCQAPVCGPSRMSFYTGRYTKCHGAHYNNIPLRIDEKTIGDHLRPQGYRVGLVGKTHMRANVADMKRLGIDPASSLGVLVGQCGFEPYERDDGLHPDQSVDPNLAYNVYLRERGYGGDNPWHDYANAAEAPDGEILSGWYLRNARLPARVADEHSETAFTTDRAMDFIRECGETPWCLHLSYIKPHWPYIVSAPYHDLYDNSAILAANRSDAERENPHPVIAAFMAHDEAQNFAKEETRQTVIPTYMGLIRQLDDHLGRLFRFLEETGRADDTFIVFTSDHGDYLGDHWLGEKELFHDESSRIPMIVYDPDPAADQSRGRVDDRLIESIDLAPTFLEIAGGAPVPHILEGRSLLSVLRGGVTSDWRDAAFSEFDYSFRRARNILGIPPHQARGYMVRTDDWKYILYEGFASQLFDMKNDPRELIDLGRSPVHEAIRREMGDRLFEWFRNLRLRTTISDEAIASRTDNHIDRGIYFGVW